MKGALLVAAALLLAGCGGCPDVACSHPLALNVTFPEPSVDEPVSGVVAYDDEQRFFSCPSADDVCEVTCGNVECPSGPEDVVVSRDTGILELAVGRMSERPSDGESSCRGAESVTISVTRGRASFEDVELEIEYQRNEAYGGSGCGTADQRQLRDVLLVAR